MFEKTPVHRPFSHLVPSHELQQRLVRRGGVHRGARPGVLCRRHRHFPRQHSGRFHGMQGAGSATHPK